MTEKLPSGSESKPLRGDEATPEGRNSRGRKHPAKHKRRPIPPELLSGVREISGDLGQSREPGRPPQLPPPRGPAQAAGRERRRRLDSARLGSADVRRRREARPSPTPGPHRGAAGHGTAPPASPRPLHAPLRARPGGRHSLLPLRPLKAVTAGTAGTAAREPPLAALLSRERGGARPSPWQPPPGLRRSAGRGGTGREAAAASAGFLWRFSFCTALVAAQTSP